ncbi:hypothetical protein L1887_16364 [Cichorium endivia]|nr:hypothetical protein L1887_16364 [Cichorium endivia]
MMSSSPLWLPLLFISWAFVFMVAGQQPIIVIPPPKPGLPPYLAPKAGTHKNVRCLSLLFPTCFNQWYPCPNSCPKNCFMDCVSCKPVCRCNMPGALCQDPRFVGGDGVTFYFHGRKDQDFCLVSDNNLHINGENWNYRNSSLQISRTSPTNGIAIEVQNSLRITATVVPIGAEESRVHGYNITDDNCFAHLDLGFKFFNLSDGVDGVLGQTYRRNYASKIKVSANMPVMGDTPKYMTSDIFATDCTISRFHGRNAIPVMYSGERF